jgi:hypothetical protein
MSELSFNVLFSQAQRKAVADLLPHLADRLKLDEKNPCTISITKKELESIRGKAEAARPQADNGMKRNSLRHVVATVAKALDESEGIGSIPASVRLYQFKITLLEIRPPIWRRIRIRERHPGHAPRAHPDGHGLDQLAPAPLPH